MRNIHNHLIGVSAFVLALGVAGAAFAESAGQYIDDATITTKVKAALLSDQQLKATQVSVETDQGTVKLSGSVDSKVQEAQAVKDANEVNGVKNVTDLLTIRGTQQQ